MVAGPAADPAGTRSFDGAGPGLGRWWHVLGFPPAADLEDQDLAGSDPHGEGMSPPGALQVPVPALESISHLHVDPGPQMLEALAVCCI